MRCISCITPIQNGRSRFCHDDHCLDTDLVQEAIHNFWQVDEIILCIQDPRSASIAATCESRGIPVRKLWIPAGTNEAELWETFSLLATLADEGEEILFDITDGRDSLPFIISLVATWMKEVRKVKIVGVIYASPPDEFGLRHFINLQPILQVIDWIEGVRALISHTNAEQMAELLTGLQGQIYRSGNEDDPPTRLKGWSHLLETFTTAIRLSRPVDALYAGWGIIHDLPRIRGEISRFAPVLLPVIKDLEIIGEMAALPSPDHLTPSYLRNQHRLIRYQINKGFNLQAVSLGREWIISLMMLRFGIDDDWLDADSRHLIARTMTGLALTMQGIPAETTQYTHLLLSEVHWNAMMPIWERVSALRNDLAHCGMNRRNDSLKSLLQRINQIPDDLILFAAYTGVKFPETDKAPGADSEI
ncbi:MAG: hypothetical protein LUQ50_01875 [Methanospirillum sp.]|uniref:TM1812 family CRISPR-associated protein n=1 Tax=Methanospirillum sp. TaxID=45200 RepID=UPI00236FB370|nr:TM1812 family CRISPR-associated protein [Methanospirillum sp.]MDD1727802.1 hypothetical protein [Methanospirillum sp.]